MLSCFCSYTCSFVSQVPTSGGQHCCAVYNNEEQLREAVMKFVLDGLNENDMICFYEAPNNNRSLTKEVIMSMFEQYYVDLEPYIQTGQLTFEKVCVRNFAHFSTPSQRGHCMSFLIPLLTFLSRPQRNK